MLLVTEDLAISICEYMTHKSHESCKKCVTKKQNNTENIFQEFQDNSRIGWWIYSFMLSNIWQQQWN